MTFMDDLIDMADSIDGSADGACFDVVLHRPELAMDHIHHGHTPPLEAYVLEPGEPHSLILCMAQADPLAHADAYRFEPFIVPADDPLLVDMDGDGAPDHTRWGTPVERVDGYIRADGTEVSGHYRTIADEVRWNNIVNSR